MGKLLGIPNVTGYMSSGGTEGNLAGIWWCKTNLTTRCEPIIKQKKTEIKSYEKVRYEERFQKILFWTLALLLIEQILSIGWWRVLP